MRMPRVRFTVRSLMVAVVVVAAVFGGWLEWRRYRIRIHNRSIVYTRAYSDHGLRAANLGGRAEKLDSQADGFTGTARLSPGSANESLRVAKDYRVQADRLRRLADHEQGLADKYNRARKSP
jgi:hypothetical protein